MAKKKRIKTFKDAWTLPFVGDPDGYTCYIWDSRNHMCFNYLLTDEVLYERIIKLLNGEEGVKPFKIVERSNLNINVSDGDEHMLKSILLVRGWGHLTGCGALHLKEETAIRLQDELIDYCVEKLKGNAK